MHTHTHKYIYIHTLSPPWIPFPPPSSFRRLMWSNMLFCWFSRLVIFIWHKLFQTVICLIPVLVLSPAPSILSEPKLQWGRLASNYSEPFMVPRRCWWRFSTGWVLAAVLPSRQHAVKSGPPNSSLPLPCCGNIEREMSYLDEKGDIHIYLTYCSWESSCWKKYRHFLCEVINQLSGLF